MPGWGRRPTKRSRWGAHPGVGGRCVSWRWDVTRMKIARVSNKMRLKDTTDLVASCFSALPVFGLRGEAFEDTLLERKRWRWFPRKAGVYKWLQRWLLGPDEVSGGDSECDGHAEDKSELWGQVDSNLTVFRAHSYPRHWNRNHQQILIEQKSIYTK